MKKLSVILLVFFWSATAFGEIPAVDSVSFFEEENILTIYFDSDILTDSVHFVIGGLTLDDDDGGINPDVTLNGGIMLNTNPVDQMVEISLLFDGYIGTYTSEDDTFDTWGTDYSRLKAIESFANKDNIKLTIRENTFLNADYEPNVAMMGPYSVDYKYTPAEDEPRLDSCFYDAGINRLTFHFDRLIQFDTINEDRIDPQTGQGDGLFSAVEDRNDNGVLDKEANLVIKDNFCISDAEGMVVLSTDIVLTTVDSDVIEIELLPDNAKMVENLIPIDDSLIVSFPAFTFLDTDYNSVAPVDSMLMEVFPDTNLLTADSTIYDMEYNKLTVYFNKILADGFGILPKISFVVYNPQSALWDTLALQGADGTPVFTGNSIKVNLLSMDQQALEDAIYGLYPSQPSQVDSINLIVDQYAFRDVAGNYNIHSVIAPITLDYYDVAPWPDSVKYDADQNTLEVYFDIQIKIQPYDINIPGFTLVADPDTIYPGTDSMFVEWNSIGFTTEKFNVSSNKKILYLLLNPDDEYLVENITDINSIRLLMEPYTVKQKKGNKANGNFAMTIEDNMMVEWVPDSVPPLPEYVRYNETSESIEIRFTDAMDSELVDWSKVTFAGWNLNEGVVSFGEDHSWLNLTLTVGDVAGIEALPDSVKKAVEVSFAPNSFTNVLGLGNEDLTFIDRDEFTVGDDTLTVLVGYGRDFFLQSKELTPTPDRIIPASIRETGAYCVIYVADDQWVPYDSVEMEISTFLTNNGLIPTNLEEVEAVFDFFENYTSVDTTFDSLGAVVSIDTLPGAYYRLNELFAGGDSTLVPVVHILLCDIRDEYTLDRTGGNSDEDFWVPSFFNSNDQYSEFEAGGNFNTNELDLIYVDTWPQLFSATDSCFHWNYTASTPDWLTFSALDGDPVTGFNAIVNAYTKMLCYKVDPWESQWMIEGLASVAELIINGEVSFYGAGNPGTPTGNALKNLDVGLDTRRDYFNTYLFMLYLYEKFGGEDFIKVLSLRPTVDIPAVDSALVLLKEQLIVQTAEDSALYDRLELFTTQYNTSDIYAYYGLACLLDTTNMAYTDSTNPNYDPLIPADDYMFRIENVNLANATLFQKNATIMKWNEVKDPPPYYFTTEPWSFGYYYSSFVVDVTENPMVNDSSIINVLLPFEEINIFEVLLRNIFTDLNDPGYYFDYFKYDSAAKKASFPVSPDTVNWSWTPGLEDTDYKSFVIVTAPGGSGKITLEAPSPAFHLSVSQSSVVSTRFDVFLVATDELWGDGAANQDYPQVHYTVGDEDSIYSVLMSPNYLIAPPDIELGLSFYSCYLDFTGTGEYSIYVYFTDLSGNPDSTSVRTYLIDTYHPGSGLNLNFKGSEIRIEAGSYPQMFNLTLSTMDYNAAPGEDQTYLYDYTLFAAPPVEGRTPIGPAYHIQPDIVLDEPAHISLPYGDYIGYNSPADLGVYLYRDGEWVYLNGGRVDPTTQTIKVRAKQLGLMQIQAGPHGETPADLLVPDRYALGQNYPNPFNPNTRINYQLPQAGYTTLKIYNIMGQEVAAIVDEFQNTGFYTVEWNGMSNSGAPIASGIYMYRLDSGEFTKSCKMIMLK